MRDAGLVRQSREYSCGAAALATLLNTLRDDALTEGDLLDVLSIKADDITLPPDWRDVGMSFATLAGLADYFGRDATGIEIQGPQLLLLKTPAIAFLPNSHPPHFTVIRSVGHRYVTLADPGWGNRRLRRRDFMQLWLDEDTDRGRLLLLNGAAASQLPGAGRALPMLKADDAPGLLR